MTLVNVEVGKTRSVVHSYVMFLLHRIYVNNLDGIDNSKNVNYQSFKCSLLLSSVECIHFVTLHHFIFASGYVNNQFANFLNLTCASFGPLGVTAWLVSQPHLFLASGTLHFTLQVSVLLLARTHDTSSPAAKFRPSASWPTVGLGHPSF
jgi:hypothetical protein